MNKLKLLNIGCSGKAWLLCLLAVLCALVCLRFGSTALSAQEFYSGLFYIPGFETQSAIIYHIRFPRVLGALLCGSGLACSGVLLQQVTGNDLAAPSIIGVNSGAGLAIVLLLLFAPSAILMLPVAAFAGAFLSALLITFIALRINSGRSGIILAGIALTSVFSALISFITLIDTDILAAYSYFSIGGLAGVQTGALIVPAILILLSVSTALVFSRRIDLLCLGDAAAGALGINVKHMRLICLGAAAACAAAAVSFAGLIGFVGLVVPHIARRMAGGNTRRLLLFSVPLGGVLVLLADLAGRTLFSPSELPVGILLALIGAPFFFWLLLRRKHA